MRSFGDGAYDVFPVSIRLVEQAVEVDVVHQGYPARRGEGGEAPRACQAATHDHQQEVGKTA